MATDRKKDTPDDEEQKRSSGKSRSGISAAAAIGKAREQLEALTGFACESVIGAQRSEDGWEVRAVVVELQRVPSTTDVLATYRVEVDGSGELLDYQRVNRYVRSQAQRDESDQ